MHASSGGGGAIDVRTELPAVLAADEAKQWAEELLSRHWQSANSVQLRLPPTRMNLGPGDLVQLPGSIRAMTLKTVDIDGMTVIVEAEPAAPNIAPLPADPGRSIPDPDVPVGRSELALFEPPALGERSVEVERNAPEESTAPAARPEATQRPEPSARPAPAAPPPCLIP